MTLCEATQFDACGLGRGKSSLSSISGNRKDPNFHVRFTRSKALGIASSTRLSVNPIRTSGISAATLQNASVQITVPQPPLLMAGSRCVRRPPSVAAQALASQNRR